MYSTDAELGAAVSGPNMVAVQPCSRLCLSEQSADTELAKDHSMSS